MVRTTMTMENRKSISSGGGENNMQRSKQLRRRIMTVRYARPINDRDELWREKVELNNSLVLIPQSI
jgi:hypothetical protein